MRNGSRLNPHLTLADIAAWLKPLQAFGRLRRGLVRRQALGALAPATASACRRGGAVGTGRALLEA